MKDPHLKSTTQGIDGLVIEMNGEAKQKHMSWATILEDKCSDSPRDIFREDVMSSFIDHHRNKRGPDLVSAAAALIRESGLDETDAVLAAARILDTSCRRYRAALAVTDDYDSDSKRQLLFRGYDQLGEITQHQRIGAIFVVDGELRGWFDKLADRSSQLLGRVSPWLLSPSGGDGRS